MPLFTIIEDGTTEIDNRTAGDAISIEALLDIFPNPAVILVIPDDDITLAIPVLLLIVLTCVLLEDQVTSEVKFLTEPPL